jgi:hypothetical protein
MRRHKSGSYCFIHISKSEELTIKNEEKNNYVSYTNKSDMPPQVSDIKVAVSEVAVSDINEVVSGIKESVATSNEPEKCISWIQHVFNKLNSYGYKICDNDPYKPMINEGFDISYVKLETFYKSISRYNAFSIMGRKRRYFILKNQTIGKDVVLRLKRDCDIKTKIHFIERKKQVLLEEDFVQITENDGSTHIYNYDEEYNPPEIEVSDDDRFFGEAWQKAQILIPDAQNHTFNTNIKIGRIGYLMTRIKPSYCVICEKEHKNMNNLIISISKTRRSASWKCSLAKDSPYIEFYKERVDQTNLPLINSEAFSQTFSSELNNKTIITILYQMDKEWDDFKIAMCDESFDDTEIGYWSDKHCVITNKVSKDFNTDFRAFERLLKSLIFKTRSLLNRFVLYFINEFYIFSSSSSKTVYIRAKPTELNPSVIRDYDINDFDNISIKYVSNSNNSSITLKKLLTQIPYHKFDGYCYKWNHDSSDKTTFSLAAPFKANLLDEVITEDDLLPEWVYYMKTILCYNDEEKWIWFRSYLANLFHQPDKRTEIMLLLYSPEKRLGKSTLHYWLELVFGEILICMVNNMSQAFGERGAPQLLNKKMGWFEELTDSKTTFRACMDRMKTAITDSKTTYRKLYQEVNQINNTNEYIAATNHLVGVLQDRFTVLRVNPERKDDRAFYTTLRKKLVGYETDKIFTYLKDFTTSMPMAILKTKEYKSMLNNASEHVVSFIKDIKSDPLTLRLTNRKDYQYTTIDDIYDTYKTWAQSIGQKDKLTKTRFRDKMVHYGGQSLECKRLKIEGEMIPCFIIQKEFFIVKEEDKLYEDEEDEEDEED